MENGWCDEMLKKGWGWSSFLLADNRPSLMQTDYLPPSTLAHRISMEEAKHHLVNFFVVTGNDPVQHPQLSKIRVSKIRVSKLRAYPRSISIRVSKIMAPTRFPNKGFQIRVFQIRVLTHGHGHA